MIRWLEGWAVGWLKRRGWIVFPDPEHLPECDCKLYGADVFWCPSCNREVV